MLNKQQIGNGFMRRYTFTLIIAILSILPLSAKQKPVRVACIDNSITYGTGLQDPKKDSYPSQLQRLIGEDYIVGNYGGLQLPAIYGSGMVLPRNRAFTLTGTANADEQVTVEIAGQKHKATANNMGKWSVELRPIAQGGPYTLKVRAKSRTIELNDILAGEVWVASGQSNMEFELFRTTTAKEDIAKADCPNIRLYDQKCLWRTDNVEWSKTALDSINRLQYYAPTSWQHCTPATAQRFSAIGYQFARELSDSLQCPVGIICNAVGGSGIEAWIDRSTLEWQMPELLRDWTKNEFIQDWVRGRARKNMAKSENPLQRHPYQPCYLFEASTQALTALPINGVVWYQGESNAHNIETHERMFRLLLNSWRNAWNDSKLPFLFVQLSSLNRPSWPWFRDSQRRLADKLPNVWMAVSSDCGDSLDVHPRNKRPIGHRLVLQALHNVYNKPVVPSGPIPMKIVFGKDDVHITMAWGYGMHTSDGQPIRTFEVAHDDGLFYPAQVELEGKTLRIWNKEVKHPRYVRYGWQPFTRANLVNAQGLPCGTFRIDR